MQIHVLKKAIAILEGKRCNKKAKKKVAFLFATKGMINVSCWVLHPAIGDSGMQVV